MYASQEKLHSPSYLRIQFLFVLLQKIFLAIFITMKRIDDTLKIK